MNTFIREYTNAILDVWRISSCGVDQTRIHGGPTADLVRSLARALARERSARLQYEIVRLVTEKIPLIPRL